MKKFIIYTKKKPISIIEVEVELITALEDPSIMWALKPGEYRARILKPTIFHQKIEKVVDGKKETSMVPDVWFSHSFYESVEEARAQAEKLIVGSFEFDLRKYGTQFTQEQVDEEYASINVVML